MSLVDMIYCSSERYRVEIELHSGSGGRHYVKVYVQDMKPAPGQRWSGHHQDMVEAEFCRFMYLALARHEGHPEEESP